jgi:hypothetical protein
MLTQNVLDPLEIKFPPIADTHAAKHALLCSFGFPHASAIHWMLSSRSDGGRSSRKDSYMDVFAGKSQG